MSVIVKSGGGKSSGLYVWKKYNVEFVLGTATTVTLQNDGTSINLYTIDNLYLKDDLTVGIQGDVAKTVAISSLLEGTVVGGMNPIYYAYGEDGFVYAYSRCSSDGTAITTSNPVTVGKGEFINYIVSDNPNAFPDGGVHSDGFFYEVFDGSGAYVWKKSKVVNISFSALTGGKPHTVKASSNDVDLSTVDSSFFAGMSGEWASGVVTNGEYKFISSTQIRYTYDPNYSFTFNFTYEPQTQVLTINGDAGLYSFGSYTKYSFVDFVVSDSETAYPNSAVHTDGYWYELYGAPFGRIVTWAGGTDEEIAAMVEAADQGIINLSDYWAVGDIRTVQLSAMSATGVGESHAAQQVDLVLMHAGGYDLNAAVASGRIKCSFVVGLKDCLADAGYMNSSNTNSGSWNGSARRTWCNNVFRNAIPSTLRAIFKQFKTVTAQTYNGSTNQTSVDYFALPAEREIFNARTYCNQTEYNALFQFDYYKTASNRVKKLGKTGMAYNWLERSPRYDRSDFFCRVISDGAASSSGASDSRGLAPFGCI